MKHLRSLYEQLGVDKYYKDYGDQYSNPHFEQVQTLIEQNKSRLDYSNVLDFCAGGGEASLVLRALGSNKITASDPFTHQLYEKNLQQKCHRWSFDDAIKGKITGDYSSIICSFAMHLCPEEKLYILATTLFQHSPSLVIITPHKRPQLEQFSGIELDFIDHTLTYKEKKVFLKHYTYAYR